MEPWISLVALGVGDLSRACPLYHDGLGWPLCTASSAESAFFLTGGVVAVPR